MQHRDLPLRSGKPRLEPFDRLRSKRHLGHEDERGATKSYGMPNSLQIDLRLATSRHAEK